MCILIVYLSHTNTTEYYWGYCMDKSMIIEAYYRGLLSKDECTQLLGIDPNVLTEKAVHNLEVVYGLEQFQK